MLIQSARESGGVYLSSSPTTRGCCADVVPAVPEGGRRQRRVVAEVAGCIEPDSRKAERGVAT